MRRREFTVAFLALSVLGCTSSQAPAPTPGKLEVTIPGTSIDRIKTTLVSEMQKRKFRIANETQSEMSFEQPASSAVLKTTRDRYRQSSDRDGHLHDQARCRRHSRIQRNRRDQQDGIVTGKES